MKKIVLLVLVLSVALMFLVSGCSSDDTSNNVEEQDYEDFGDSGGEETGDSGEIQPPPFPEE